MPPKVRRRLYVVRLKDFVTLETNSDRYAKYGDNYLKNGNAKDYYYVDIEKCTKFTSMRLAILARDLYGSTLDFPFEDIVHIDVD